MIYVISEEKFKKYAQDLTEPKYYVIVDATDYTNPPFRDYKGVVCWAGLNPPKKLVKAFEAEKDKKKDTFATSIDSDEGIDKKTQKKLFKKYQKSEGFQLSIMAILNAIYSNEEEINVFIILRKNVYKNMGEAIVKAMCRFLDIDGNNNCIYAFDLSNNKDRKKMLKTIEKDTPKHDRKVLEKRFKKLQEELGNK